MGATLIGISASLLKVVSIVIVIGICRSQKTIDFCTHFSASVVAVKTNSGVAVPITLGTCEGCSWSIG